MKEIISSLLRQKVGGITDSQCEKFCDYAQFLVSENEKYNLTALTSPEDVALKHFVDSVVSLSLGFEPKEGESVIDVGSGAGLPGIPLKIMRPEISLAVLDSTEKKVVFMKQAAERIGYSVGAVAARAEEAASRPDMRDSFDYAVSRGVAALNVLCELCMPFVKVGGVFLAYKGKSGEEELDAAKSAIKALGGKTERVEKLSTDGGDRTLIFIRKFSPTPSAYPRQYAKIKKKPL